MGKSYLLFVDLEKAFDRISRQKLIQLLRSRSLNDKDKRIVNLIEELLTKNTLNIGGIKV
jgi:hypothetical protein